MKIRESGMPEEELWEHFFDPPTIFQKLGLNSNCSSVAEFGCGYGTFTLPLAQIIQGTVYAFDIESSMVTATTEKIQEYEIDTAQVELRDFITQGTGLPDQSVDYVMMFNILHTEKPGILLQEAWRILRPNGKVGIIHWNYDPSTPRGPSMEIRPRPEECRTWAESVGFVSQTGHCIDLPPYHYGWVLVKSS